MDFNNRTDDLQQGGSKTDRKAAETTDHKQFIAFLKYRLKVHREKTKQKVLGIF